MEKYKVKITGETPLLLHHDNITWAEKMKLWMKDPANKKDSVAGDDRTPAWRWIGNLYVDGVNKIIAMPADNIMTMLREGGTKCLVGTGKKTFKAQTQSGIVMDQMYWPLTVNGKTACYEKIGALIGNKDFEHHIATVNDLGFDLHVKRAKVGQNKHIRVRPFFSTWECEGVLTVIDDQITREVLENVLNMGGTYSGLGDWRPSSPRSPGPYGRFTADIENV